MTVRANHFDRYPVWLNPTNGRNVRVNCLAELEENHQRVVVFQNFPGFGKCYILDYMVFCKSYVPVGPLGVPIDTNKE